MKDRFKPELTYAFAWEYVQFANEYSKPGFPPYNLAEIFNAISHYLANEKHYRHEGITFESYLFVKLIKLYDRRISVIEESKPPLVEFYITRADSGYHYLTFPKDVNYGWQTATHKQYLIDHTFLHGYVRTKDEAETLLNKLQEGYFAFEMLMGVSKKLDRIAKKIID